MENVNAKAIATAVRDMGDTPERAIETILTALGTMTTQEEIDAAVNNCLAYGRMAWTSTAVIIAKITENKPAAEVEKIGKRYGFSRAMTYNYRQAGAKLIVGDYDKKQPLPLAMSKFINRIAAAPADEIEIGEIYGHFVDIKTQTKRAIYNAKTHADGKSKAVKIMLPSDIKLNRGMCALHRKHVSRAIVYTITHKVNGKPVETSITFVEI